MIKHCIIHCRVSTAKQSQEGESLETQEKICRDIARKKNAKILKVWSGAFSGRLNPRKTLEEIKLFVKNTKTPVDYLIFRDIDRLTRGGGSVYQMFKDELGEMGVELVDSYGLIQPTINTLESTGFEYPWSRVSPSGMAERIRADAASDEVKGILTRLIGSEIKLTQQGYQIGRPNDGFLNKRIFVGSKKKMIQSPDPERAKFYVKMFELRASGKYTDKEIVKKMNAMGFKTRVNNKWDKNKQNIIGRKGGKSLTVKQLQKNISHPIYAGIICRKWTNYQPIKAKFEGLVSVDLFNKANQGKIFIKESGNDNYQLLYDYYPEKTIKKRTRNNPLFPFKNIILCPYCNQPFMASSPRSKSGKRHPTYHCNRNHKYFGINKKEFEDNIREYVENLKFSRKFMDTFEFVLKDTWRKKQQEILNVSANMNHNIANLKSEKESAVRTLIGTGSDIVRKELEKRIEKLEEEIQQAEGERAKIDLTEKEIQEFINYANFLMEHLEILLLDNKNIQTQQALFGLVFEEFPTYQQILNGTPKLSFIFELSESFKKQKSPNVDAEGVEPPTYWV